MGIKTRRGTRWLLHVSVAVTLLGVPVVAGELLADDDDEHGDEHGDEDGDEDEIVPPATDPLYKAECSDCHFVYPPGLLPARSWKGLLERTEDHFGVELSLDADTRTKIAAYLAASSAETERNEISRKIVKSLAGKAPPRITEVPYLRKKHRKIKAAVFARESVGGRWSCTSCHRTAEKGDFDDDNVKIPKK